MRGDVYPRRRTEADCLRQIPRRHGGRSGIQASTGWRRTRPFERSSRIGKVQKVDNFPSRSDYRHPALDDKIVALHDGIAAPLHLRRLLPKLDSLPELTAMNTKQSDEPIFVRYSGTIVNESGSELRMTWSRQLQMRRADIRRVCPVYENGRS